MFQWQRAGTGTRFSGNDIVGFNAIYRQTILVWKDGMKVLGQRSLEEVVDRMSMEGMENEE